MNRAMLALSLILAGITTAPAQFRGRDDDSRENSRFDRRDDRDRNRRDDDRRRFDRDQSENDDDSRRRQRRFDPNDFFDRLDNNGDGQLDEDEIPDRGRVRIYLERAGIEQGASRDEFLEGFERVRQERERRSEDRDNAGKNERSPPVKGAAYVPNPNEPVTIPLPETFVPQDANNDGQVAFHEWRRWDWSRIDEFFFFDRNGDGFLTPREIVETTGIIPPPEAPNSSPGQAAEPATSRAVPRRRPPPPQTPIKLDENNRHVKAGRRYFELLDSNEDGTASVAELKRLNNLRPLFENAGIRLDRPMTNDQFTASYYQAATLAEQ